MSEGYGEPAPWQRENNSADGEAPAPVQQPNGSSGENVDPDEMVDMCVAMWNSANEDERLAERVASADTVVSFHFTDGGDDTGLTLVADQTPIEARAGVTDDAEVHMYGAAQSFLDMVRQESQMAMAITRGEVTYKGPVRKFLRIVPIMRRLNFDMFSHHNGQPASSDS